MGDMKKYILGILLMISAITVNAQCDYSKVTFNYTNNCGKVSFNLGEADTCLSYYLDLSNLGNGNLLTFDTNIVNTVIDTGLYTVQLLVSCKCFKDNGKQIYKLIYFGCDSGTVSVTNIFKTTPKVVMIWDMLGRPVDKVEDNIPYIFLYDNGQRKKIVKIK